MGTDIIADHGAALVPAPAMAPARSGEQRDIRIGWIVVLLFFGVFLGFGAFVRLDAAAYANGMVSVAGNRQAVQHRDGGVVASLKVSEGQHVQAGQVLIELAGAEVAANERGLAAQVIGLQAERARLLAERAGAATIAPPPEFAALRPEDRQLAAAALRLEANVLATNRNTIAAQKRVLTQQAAQLGQKVTGLGQQLTENETQRSLFDDQLKGMQGLVGDGYASINRVRELERARAELSSQRANMSSNAAATREQIGETRMQALTLDSKYMQDISANLRKDEDSLAEVQPRWEALKRQVAQTQIRAPTTGQVVGLKVFTVGGVIAPGERLMEIVPDAMPLVIEAQFSPNDADDVRVGQTAEVRFVTIHNRNMPVFEGKVTRVSADSFADEAGARFYTGQVVVPAQDLARVGEISGGAEGIKPGLPAQILVPLRKRTLLQYLVEPINQALWRSGHEH